MKQEVQVILTFEVDATKSKKDIEDFFHDMDQTYTRSVSARNRWEFSKLTLVEVKEEAEIYETENPALEVITEAARYIRNGRVVPKELYTHYKKGGEYYIEDDNAFIKLRNEWVPCVTYRSTDKAVKKLFIREREEFYLKLSKI